MIPFRQAAFEAAFGTVSQLTQSDLPEVVFAGRSNVGKSSLLNRLFERKSLARVSSTPGKTITINFYRCGDVRFADLPGYGFARRSNGEKRRWAELMEHYFSSGRNIRLVVQLIDMRHPMSADDRQMLSFLQETATPFVVVLTKADKLNKTERAAREKAMAEEFAFLDSVILLPFSAVTGEGVEKLRSVIENALA